MYVIANGSAESVNILFETTLATQKSETGIGPDDVVAGGESGCEGGRAEGGAALSEFD